MAFHVIYRESNGWMWQSYEQDAATPLPDGYSQPDGHAIVSFASPPAAGTVWEPTTLTFVAPLVGEKAIAKAEVDRDEYGHPLTRRAFVLLVMDELNIVRTEPLTIHPKRTASQIKTALKNKIDTL